ncbi:MAG TPA: pitrilysin family protein [Steroidobacteraceae bacterium]
MSTRICTALLGLFLCATVVRAAELAPQPGPPRPFTIPTPTKLTLANGVQVTFIDFGSVPKVTIAINVRVGALNDGEQTWLSDLTAELMKEGTEFRTAEQIAEEAAEMGGQVAIGVGADQTTLSLDVLSEYGADAVALLAEILTRPRLPESELPRIRQNFLRNLSVQLATPQAQAEAAFAALLFPNHPYGRVFPTPEQLQAYSIEDVRRFYERNFGGQRTHVYVAGKFDRARVEAAVRRHLGGWRDGPAPLRLPSPEPSEPVTVLIDRPDAPQSTLRIGLRVIDPSHPEFMPLSVTNTLLGGGLTSRITMNLRETKGWAYSPSSSVGAYYRHAVWAERADVKAESTGPALQEIYREIDRLRREPPTDEELASIKNYRNGIFVMSNASRVGLIGQFAFMDLHGLPTEWLTTFIDRLYAVTPEQVSQAAREHLEPTRMSVVVVGNLSQVRKQLEEIELLPKIQAQQ